ncbi:MAG: HEAT repeat domain-containing protein [Chloroflexota bacterium]|nr:HEAT repeat domain-containing protein [Chloroflexota bacterium]
MIAARTSATSAEPSYSAQPLLPLKLTPPPPRDGVLLRPDLQSLLAEVRLHPITLVVAPAGYGKTTLLAQWVQELSRTSAPIGWLTLDRSERDPAMFLAYLIRAFQLITPTLGADAWRVLSSVANLQRDWPLVAGALCSDLQRQLATATFLVLDDLQQISDSAVIGQILGYIVRAAPPTLHIVIASRRAPTFAPLPRLRAEGHLLELSQRDLHLSTDEARQVLAAQNVTLDDAGLALLLARTEGWALSVQLAARALAGQSTERRADFLRALEGTQEQLLSYLATEVLADLPDQLIDFLRLAALPERFDAVLLTEVLGRDDVGYLLGRAQALGLPILPLDEHGDLLRFHPLWREMLLRTEFRGLRTEQKPLDSDLGPPSLALAQLHRRFGSVLEARGDLEEALGHYAAAGAADELARALRQRAWPLLQSPRRDSVRGWLEQIPPDLRENDAELLYMWGYSQIAAAPAQAVTAIEHAADRFRQAGLHPRELRALADLATLLYLQANAPNFVACCVRAIRAANYGRDAWSRGAALVGATAMLYTKGRYVAALQVARQAAGQPLNTAWHWLLAMLVSSINIRLGQPTDALTIIDEALHLPQVDHDDRLRQNLLRQRAMALYQQGQVTEATTLALDAHRHLSDYYHDGSAGFSARQLALLLVLQGRVDEATTYVVQARTAFHDMGALEPLASLQAIELYAQLLRGQAARARAAVPSLLRRLDETEGNAQDLQLRLLLALVLGEGGDPQRALALTREIAIKMAQQGYRLFLTSAQFYTAYLAGLCDDEQTRDAALRAGWSLVASDNQYFIPMLPPAALHDVVVAALRAEIAPPAISQLLRRQMPEQAMELLRSLLDAPEPTIRANAAHLLGELGTSAAYPSLRALLKDRSAPVRKAAEDALSRLVYRPPYTLRVRSLGAFGIWRGDHEVRDRDWRSTKARQLFQLLLTERGRMLPRDRVLEALWPEMDPEAAANNLRVTLNRLGKAVEPDRPEGAPPAYLIQQGDTYGFNIESDHHLDAADFAEAVASGQRAARRGQRAAAITAFRTAIGLYGGPYLPDNMYEDWTVIERERLAMLFNDAAMRLGTLLLEEGLAHEAIGLAWRVLENDRAHEEAYRLLMRAHATLGERSTALRLYARCVTMLQDELGVEPLPETTSLYNTLREMR